MPQNKILVTGDMGFIGTHLSRTLKAEGFEVFGCDWQANEDFAYLTHEDLVNYKMVVHLAGSANVRESIENPDLYLQNNAVKTKELQLKCFVSGTPLLYASSSSAYVWEKTPYGASKKMTELTAQPGQVGLRFGTVYGQGARDTMLISRMLNGTLRYGTRHFRDFVYVGDIVAAIMIFVREGLQGKQPIYDVGTGNAISIEELCKIYDPKIDIIEGFDFEASNNMMPSIEIKKLGWSPITDVKDYVKHLKGII